MHFITRDNTSTEKKKERLASQGKQLVRTATEKRKRGWSSQEKQIVREQCILEVSVERTLSSKRSPG